MRAIAIPPSHICLIGPRRLLLGLALLSLALGLLPAGQEAHAQTASEQQFAGLSQLYMKQKYSGDWQSAGQTARRMITLATQRGLEPVLRIASIDYLALVELNLGNFDESAKLYQQVVDEAKQTRGSIDFYENNRTLVLFNGYNGLALTYREAGHQDKAAKAFEAAIEYARSVRREREAAYAGSHLGHLLLDQGNTEEALVQFRKTLTTLRKEAQKRDSNGADKTAYANALQGMASGYMDQGKYNKAEPLARAAGDWAQAAAGGNSTYRAAALKTLGLIYSYENRYTDAVHIYEECVRIFGANKLEDTPRCLGIMNNLSRMYVITGQPEKGIQMGELVVAKARMKADESERELITPLVNLGNIYFQLDMHEKAAKTLKEAMDLSDKYMSSKNPAKQEAVRLFASNEFLRGGDKKTVLKQLSGVITAYESVPTKPDLLAAVYAVRAEVHYKLGNREKAIQDMEEAIKYAEQQRSLASGGERERATLFETYSQSYGMLLAWNVELGAKGLDKAFTLAETMKARSFMDALRTANFDLLEDLSDEQRASFEAEEKKLRDALTIAQQKYDAIDEKETKQLQQAAYAVYVARDRLYDHMITMQNANPTHRKLITNSNEPATLKDVQQELLKPNELMLSYIVFRGHTFVFSVQKDSQRVQEIKVNAAQAKVLGIEPGELSKKDLAKIFLDDAGLIAVLSRPKESPTMNARLAALWEVLVPEADRKLMLDGSLDLVTILPDGLLSLLPFDALVISTDEDHVEYLLDAGPPLAYAPSASVLMNLVERPAYEQQENREPVLTLGDPAYRQTSGGDARGASFRAGLARLPFSGNEATWVSQHFKQQGVPSIKLTRDQATEAQLRQLIRGREIVHLACHGMAENQYGNFFGCLALAPGRQGDANDDGFLYTPEIYTLNLKGCELAILSACETNFGPQQTGEGVWTLSRGFLVSGARRVLASNWVVNDAAGATLVSYFAHELAKSNDHSHRSYAAGLQHAKQSLRKQYQWTHPFYWSGLTLVGPN